jgi:ABC-type uncharacterized transport system ATPase subunit
MGSSAGTGSELDPAVDLQGISKRFGAIVACDDVDLRLYHGRIHGILGENGAGKSTLMKVLIGLVPVDSGQVLIDGVRQAIRDPLEAARHGIGMVHQHFSLVEALTVWENVALGDSGRFEPTAARRRVAEISEHYGLGVDPDARVADLPAGVRQRVEIIKCLRRDPEIIIFDEPTSVLTPGESQRLFEVLRIAVRDENKAVALVSHKLDEVLQATDEITIMRAGRVVEEMTTADADAPRLARAMVGRNVSLRSEAAALGLVGEVEPVTEHDSQRAVDTQDAVPALSLKDVVVVSADGTVALDRLSVDVWPGEILGVAGVEGNGQAAITEVLSSLVMIESGTIEVGGVAVTPGRAGAMARAGVGVVPADRHDSGCVLDMTVAENLFLVHIEQLASHGFYDQSEMSRRAAELIEEFEIQTPGPDAPFFTLSGGNQQRVILARELSQGPKALIADQPTHGLDVGAIEYMSSRLKRVAEEGVGVLLISSELEELLHLAHRIVVLFRGRIVGEMARGEVDLERLGLLMGGSVDVGSR